MADVPVLYVLFDLLWFDGQLLTDEPYVEGHRRLESLALKGPNWQLSPQLPDVPDDDMLQTCRDIGVEGYLGKMASSAYVVGKRSKAWTKVKAVRQREFVVGGWSEGSGGRSGQIGSLAVGWPLEEAGTGQTLDDPGHDARPAGTSLIRRAPVEPAT